MFDMKMKILVAAAIVFLVLQMRTYSKQSNYADRISSAIEGELKCNNELHGLIEQISTQRGRIQALEEERERLDGHISQLTLRVQEFENSKIRGLVTSEPVAAVVVMACNRADYLDRTMKSILKYHGSVASKFPLFISQDGTDEAVKHKAKEFSQFTYMQHLDNEPIQTERPGEILAYYRIARHYKWALGQLFDRQKFQRVIILEDDMELAPDFFEYFEATATLLDQDSSLIAVSSWNDNGQGRFVHDPEALYRSDFFPGLGWMMKKTLWDELSPKWPKAYWDDWLRLNETRKGRQFIRPEICRNYNFGKHGSSFGQFFSQYLETIKLNDVRVNWESKDLSYLLKDNFRKYLGALVAKAMPIPASEASRAHHVNGDVQIQYDTQETFERIARELEIFSEWKDGVPRTAYEGVVVFRLQSRHIFVVHSDSMKRLQVS